jgi:hypothetical protein
VRARTSLRNPRGDAYAVREAKPQEAQRIADRRSAMDLAL